MVDNHAATLFWGAKPAQQQRDLLQAYTQLTTPLVDDQAAPVFFNAYDAFRTETGHYDSPDDPLNP